MLGAKKVKVISIEQYRQLKGLTGTNPVNEEKKVKDTIAIGKAKIKKEKKKAKEQKVNSFFTALIRSACNLELKTEVYFAKPRRYRFDYANEDLKIAVEQNGGIWMKGQSGHSSGKGIKRDMDKTNLAVSLGWIVITRTPQEMNSLQTIELIKAAINQQKLKQKL